MKKEITLAVLATILILQLIGNTVGGFVGDLAENLSDVLANRIQVETMLPGGQYRDSE